MPRLNEVKPEQASGPLEEIYSGLNNKMGKVINIFQGMANSPAALKAYLDMSSTLATGELSAQDRELIYLAASENNGCQYCVSAHTVVAEKAGLSVEQAQAARLFRSADSQKSALLTFVQRVIETRGFVSDDELQAVRDAGYSDGQIAETIGYIGLATFSNLFNHVHQTELDFPSAAKL